MFFRSLLNFCRIVYNTIKLDKPDSHLEQKQEPQNNFRTPIFHFAFFTLPKDVILDLRCRRTGT